MNVPRLLVLTSVGLTLAGCPDGASKPIGSKTAPQPATRPGTNPGVNGSSGPEVRYPRPEDGRDQTDLVPEQTIDVGGNPLKVWVVATRESRTLGLMHVKSMPADRGMLFVYPESQRMGFWMKNTFIPLSLAYIRGDGTIEQLVDMEPHDTQTRESHGKVRLVLEVNQGWFARKGVKVGTRIPGIENLLGYR